MTDKSKQQFEEFIKFHMDGKVDNDTFETANNGLNYSYPYVDLMWITWQASRESLEVELPVTSIFEIGSAYDSGYHNGVKECKEILISNGVKIK